MHTKKQGLFIIVCNTGYFYIIEKHTAVNTQLLKYTVAKF